MSGKSKRKNDSRQLTEEIEDRELGKYHIGEALGRGAFGVVYKGLNFETGETVAIKRISTEKIAADALASVEAELDLLKKLNHPNIVSYVGCHRSEKHLNIILEYIENGSLQAIVKKFGKFPETLVAVYTMQVLEGLEYLHEQHVVHRDIKAANILTTKEGTVKLADFGVATLAKVDNSNEAALGSPYWMAPEIISMKGAQTASDIWSLGCTIIELMMGQPPFFNLPPLSALYHIAESDEMPPFPKDITEDLTDFLKQCFERDPTKRPTAEDLLSHPWIETARERKGGSGSFGKAAGNAVLNVSKKRKNQSLRGPKNSNGKADKPGILRSISSAQLGIWSSLEEITKLEEQLEQFREKVILEVRNNRLLEQQVKRLDKKIELLIKNRITLEEVLNTPKSTLLSKTKFRGSLNVDEASLKDPKMLEGYSKLFYVLQANPQYLANFIFFEFDGVEEMIETIILTLYGYAFSAREEFLLLSFLGSAISREIKNLSDITAFQEGAALLIQMVMAYCRRVQEQEFIRSLLGNVIEQVLAKANVSLEIQPMKVYKDLINEEEMTTGGQSTLNPDATEIEVRNNPRVQEQLKKRVRQLIELSDLFINAIINSLDFFPYGLRWISKQIRLALNSKFKNATNTEIMPIIGYLVYYRFMNPAIVTPDDYEMADSVSNLQRTNLINISKILSNVVNNKYLEGRGSEVEELNSYIKKTNERFWKFLDQVTQVSDPIEQLQIDQKYIEYTQTQKPVIYISPNEIFLTHKLLREHLDKLAPNKDDSLRKVISSLPAPPPIIDDPKMEAEISLTLQPEDTQEVNIQVKQDKEEVHKFYSLTKKMICEIIKDSYKEHLNELNLLDLLTGSDVKMNSKLTLQVAKILENLEKLEKNGMVSKANSYKKIMDDIHKDVASKTEMRGKLEKELTTLKNTMDKLKEKKDYLEKQLNEYNGYVKACLEQSVVKKKASSKKKKLSTLKYTCAQLIKKGVIVEIDIPSSQHSSVSLELGETDQVGTYEAQIYFAAISVEKIKLEIDDLLEKQYNGEYFVYLLDRRCKLRINLLIHILNKIAVQ
jgi:Ras GTPase-activating-like protein IQGAP2/3